MKLYQLLDRPLLGRARVLLAILVVPLALSLTSPLWRITLTAPQYPRGLTLDVWAYTIEGGNHGQHLAEINTLNHYIGMHKIDRGELSDLDWIPFAIGGLLLLTLRCAVVGNVRALVDLVVLTGYVAVFSMGRFAYKMYVFGHHLDPDAPVKVAPFTPALFGSKQIANFTTASYPGLGTAWVSAFFAGVVALLVWQLIADREPSARRAPPAPPAAR
jgi:hypothetical protein